MKVAVLTGGVGGAKLVLGLTRILAPETITAIVNTGDDFTHLGLPISPDIDTLLYTLSGKADAARGWGREAESWSFMAALASLGGPEWFNLGDGDLALHVLRLAGAARGETLSAMTEAFARRWGIATRVLPMSDDAVSTLIDTDIGRMSFQDYFVRRRCEPVLRGVVFEGAERARPTPAVLAAIAEAEVILIAPSNPWLSVDPILSVPGIGQALAHAAAPVVAVSPLVNGRAVKGPTAKLMTELGLPLTHASIASHYGDWLGGLLVDSADDASGVRVAIGRTATLMLTMDDRARVARAALDLADFVSSGPVER